MSKAKYLVQVQEVLDVSYWHDRRRVNWSSWKTEERHDHEEDALKAAAKHCGKLRLVRVAFRGTSVAVLDWRGEDGHEIAT